MPRIPLPIIGGSDKATSPAHDAGRSVNVYVEVINKRASLKHVPGSFRRVDFTIRQDASLELPADAPIRGRHVMGSRLFVVVRNRVLEAVPTSSTADIDAESFVQRGTLTTVSGPVGFSDSAGKLVIGDGRYWTLDLETGALSPVLNSGEEQLLGYWPEWLDGTTLYPIRGTSTYSYSAVDDPTTVMGLSVFAAEGNPDNILRMHVVNTEIKILGSDSTEDHYDNGNEDNPFQRIDGGFVQYGCVGMRASCKFDNTVVMVGGNTEGAGRVFRLQGAGAQPTVISTPAVEKAIEKVLFAPGNLASQITMYAYDDQGHAFFLINLPAVGATINNPEQASMTWGYDGSTGLWHERAFKNPATGLLERHVGDLHAYWRGRHYLGAYNAPHLYEMSRDYFRENTVEIVKMRELGPVNVRDFKEFDVADLGVEMEVAVGRDGGVQGSDPEMMMQWRMGYGAWSDVIVRKIGKMGEGKTVVQFGPCGFGKDFQVRLSISDPVRVTITDLWADVNIAA